MNHATTDKQKTQVNSVTGVYHKKKFLEEYKDRFQKILIRDAKRLPIKKLSPLEQKPFVEIVSRIEVETKNAMASVELFSGFLKSSLAIDRLSRKLQFWDTLSFQEFIIEMNKALKKGGRVKMSKVDEIDWMEVFSEKKSEAQAFRKTIEETDEVLDGMVFELYGLSGEEIDTVISSFK